MSLVQRAKELAADVQVATTRLAECEMALRHVAALATQMAADLEPSKYAGRLIGILKAADVRVKP